MSLPHDPSSVARKTLPKFQKVKATYTIWPGLVIALGVVQSKAVTDLDDPVM